MIRKKAHSWTEAELIDHFNLERYTHSFPLLEKWLNVEIPTLENYEQILFRRLLVLAQKKADFWNEETLKMNFIAPLLNHFVVFNDTQDRYEGFFDYTISATVEDTYLQTETDFMLAKGVGDIAKTPYFHFQEYKRSKKSPPDPLAQLLKAFLIAQAVNQNQKPIYGAIIVGRTWQFVILEGKKYGISTVYDVTQEEALLQIIAILRHFKEILETKLLE